MKIGFLKKNIGSVVIEATLTLPIMVMMIFFILEMVKVNNAKSAIEAISNQATFSFIANRNTNEFEEIITKHLPGFIQREDVKWYFAVYKDLDTMCAEAPYGLEEIYWPPTEEYLDSDGSNTFNAKKGDLIEFSKKEKPEEAINVSDPNYSTLSGKVFVLTFVCNFRFSSAFVAKIFHGGSNTKAKEGATQSSPDSEGGGKFLLWGRGIGICN